MNAQRAAEIQVVLEGVALPATKAQLLAYARANDASVVPDLQTLPDRDFRRLDDVGEFLTLVPAGPKPGQRLPRPESGAPPGGDDYLTPSPSDTGKVRYTAPPANPPQQAIEKASKTQKRQKAAQD